MAARMPANLSKPRPRDFHPKRLPKKVSDSLRNGTWETGGGNIEGGPFSVVDQIKRHRGPMSVADLAPILGVSDDVLYRMVRDGKIPQLIIPGRSVTRFDPASIVFWLCKHNPLLHQVQKVS